MFIGIVNFSFSGLVTVPAGGGGTFLGGYLIKRFNLPCSGILKFCLLATAACIAFTLCFALNCPNLDFAGLTVPYHNNTKFVHYQFDNAYLIFLSNLNDCTHYVSYIWMIRDMFFIFLTSSAYR